MTRLAIRNYANAGNARKWLLMMARSLHCPPDRLTLLLYLSFSVFHHLIGHSADLHLIETACTDPSRELQLNGATSIRQMTFSRVFLLGLHLTESHSWLVVCPQWAVTDQCRKVMCLSIIMMLGAWRASVRVNDVRLEAHRPSLIIACHLSQHICDNICK